MEEVGHDVIADGIRDEGVGTGTAGQPVIADAADQQVVSEPTLEHVVAGAATQRVGPRGPLDIKPLAGGEGAGIEVQRRRRSAIKGQAATEGTRGIGTDGQGRGAGAVQDQRLEVTEAGEIRVRQGSVELQRDDVAADATVDGLTGRQGGGQEEDVVGRAAAQRSHPGPGIDHQRSPGAEGAGIEGERADLGGEHRQLGAEGCRRMGAEGQALGAATGELEEFQMGQAPEGSIGQRCVEGQAERVGAPKPIHGPPDGQELRLAAEGKCVVAGRPCADIEWHGTAASEMFTVWRSRYP